MRETFIGYYRPTEEEFKEMWAKALFSVDANILLNIYRYRVKLREALFTIFEKLGDRLWVTYQAAEEFHRRRLGVIEDQAKRYYEVVQQLDKITESLKALRRHHAYIDLHGMADRVAAFVAEQKGALEHSRDQHPDLAENDPLWERLATLLAGKVGKRYTTAERAAVMKEVKSRVDARIPPGWKDSNKTDDDGVPGYGDVLIWLQLKAKVLEGKHDQVIFVTDDSKEDWWIRKGGKTLGPLPELIHEMRDEAGGARLYIYKGDQFIKYGSEHFGIAGGEQLAKEAKEVRRSVHSRPSLTEITLRSEVGRAVDGFLVLYTPLPEEKRKEVARIILGYMSGGPAGRAYAEKKCASYGCPPPNEIISRVITKDYIAQLNRKYKVDVLPRLKLWLGLAAYGLFIPQGPSDE
jgi:hypothetical protein